MPGDLSVVGFDNIPESALCSPPLTTVKQPIRQMGERSIQLLLQLMRGDHLRSTHITLATDLVVRQSTRAPVAGVGRRWPWPGAHLGRPMSIVVDNVL